jgi:predicted aspartyl protease
MEEMNMDTVKNKIEALELEIEKVEEMISVLIDRGIDNVYILQLREILHSLMEYQNVVRNWAYSV